VHGRTTSKVVPDRGSSRWPFPEGGKHAGGGLRKKIAKKALTQPSFGSNSRHISFKALGPPQNKGEGQKKNPKTKRKKGQPKKERFRKNRKKSPQARSNWEKEKKPYTQQNPKKQSPQNLTNPKGATRKIGTRTSGKKKKHPRGEEKNQQ